MKRLRALRGAIDAENTAESIAEAVILLTKQLVGANDLSEKDIVSIVIGTTPDLDAAVPATALRRSDIFARCPPLMSTAEPSFKDAPPRIIRLLVTARSKKCRNVYLGGAADLLK